MRRLVFGLFGLLGLSFLSFVLIYYSQGSVAFANVSQGMSSALRYQIEENLNLHQPMLKQYETWLFNALRGDFAVSLVSGEDVLSIIKERLPNTLILGGVAFGGLVILSLFLGLASLFSPTLDRLMSIVGLGFAALPAFSISLLLILFFSVLWPIFPSSGASGIGVEENIWDRILHLVLPVSALILSHLGIFVQFVRTTLNDSLNQSFIQFGLARGLSFFYIATRWIFKYSLPPMISYFAASFVSFMVGVYVVEGVFSYGGIGSSLINGLIFKDYPLILAILTLSFLAVMIVNFVADCLCEWLNQGRV
ncbi:ABC transporter permease [Helicobacter pametensis]|uniref:ABC transporter permease n=1 Tax=Helicobacter pametensis TaxID=95149 RepID=UPI000553E187|nr:ABC transporter permease [Helicobacter pametensis]